LDAFGPPFIHTQAMGGRGYTDNKLPKKNECGEVNEEETDELRAVQNVKISVGK